MLDPKPTRERASRSEYGRLSDLAYEQTRGACGCGCGRRAASVHHLAGGIDREDVLENLLPLAGDGTRLCHGALTSGNVTCDYASWRAPVVARIRPIDVRRGIRRTLEDRFPEKLAYLLERKGGEWLDARYPRS